MRFNFPSFSNIKNINFPILLISFIIAIGAWYIITISERTDVYLHVLLDYQNAPENLVVIDGLIPSIDVQIRGPKNLLTGENSRNPSIVVDLSNLQIGKNVRPFAKEAWGNQYRAFEVLEMEPTHLVIETEPVLKRSVIIVPQLDVKLDDDSFKVVDINLSPSTALVKGPQSTVQAIKTLDLDLRIDPKEKAGTYTKNFPLVVAQRFTDVTPNSIKVTYTVASKRARINLEKRVSINGPVNNFVVDPQEVQFEAEIPEGLLKDTEYHNRAMARVTPPLHLDIGQSAPVTLTYNLPDGMTLVDDSPRTIVITRVQ